MYKTKAYSADGKDVGSAALSAQLIQRFWTARQLRLERRRQVNRHPVKTENRHPCEGRGNRRPYEGRKIVIPAKAGIQRL